MKTPHSMNPYLVQATVADYPMIQNMARLYVYDMSRECGLYYPGWECPADGLFECINLRSYFEEPDRKAFLVKVQDEVAGFVLIKKLEIMPEVDFNMGEFFILAKFQRTGLAYTVATEIFNTFRGQWSVGVIPENLRALAFWRKCIGEYTSGNYIEKAYPREELVTAEHPDPFPMIIMRFDS